MKSTYYKNKARLLRGRGYSLREISQKFPISKSTASLWTKDVSLNRSGIERVRRNALIHREKGHQILHGMKLKRLARAENEAGAYFASLEPDTMHAIIALSMVYWCEGAKDDRRIAFTNSDPELARAFIVMLKKVFSIDKSKIKVQLHLHDYHDQKDSIEFWSTALQIPLSQFTSPYKKKSDHLHIKEGYKGCVRITYHDAHIARVILSFAKKFIKLYI